MRTFRAYIRTFGGYFMVDDMQLLGDAVLGAIKARKNALGMTNQQLADAAGIPLSNVKKYMSGDIKNPSLFYTAAACRVLGLSLDDLLGLEARQPEREQSHRHRALMIIAGAALVIAVAALIVALAAVF